MAHTTTFKCDHCGEEIKEDMVVLHCVSNLVKDRFPDGIDLCNTCILEFLDWISCSGAAKEIKMGPVERIARRAE